MEVYVGIVALWLMLVIAYTEREAMWQEVLAERRRRLCVTPLVQYCCEQRVTSPDTCPVRWPGIEGVLQAYQAYYNGKYNVRKLIKPVIVWRYGFFKRYKIYRQNKTSDAQ